MIRVGHILPFMEVGGMEQIVLCYSKFRNQEEFDYMVGTTKEGVIADEIRSTGTPVYTGEGSFDTVMGWADIVNLHWVNYHQMMHEHMLSYGKPYVITLHWQSRLPKLPALTICTAKHVYDIQDYKDRFVIISNGVDISRFHPRPREKRSKVIITRVGRSSKCATYFWKSMNKILNKYPNTELWIVGNDDGRRRYSDRIHLLGIRRDVPEILAETDIFVYTPYPHVGTKDLVIMEALAMGVPCVVSNVKTARESVEHGKSGFLVPYGDVDALTQAVEKLVVDTELRLSMGHNAAEIAKEQFDMSRINRRYEAVYKTVMKSYLDSWTINSLFN
jgi:glycosyltransferase involved in cell wall biosynthesis